MASTTTAPVPSAVDVSSWLQALARALAQSGLAVTVEQRAQVGLRAVTPEATDHADRITCRSHTADRSARWPFIWRDPISPACDIRAAVARVRAALMWKAGVRREA